MVIKETVTEFFITCFNNNVETFTRINAHSTNVTEDTDSIITYLQYLQPSCHVMMSCHDVMSE